MADTAVTLPQLRQKGAQSAEPISPLRLDGADSEPAAAQLLVIMGLILLIVIGGILGWLASIVTQSDDRQGVLFNVAAGICGALVGGLASYDGAILSGLSAVALLVSFVSSLAALVLANLFRNRQLG